MHSTLHREGPPCFKCERPTIFHSFQIVAGAHGDETMEVFVCETCDLLSAAESTVASGKAA